MVNMRRIPVFIAQSKEQKSILCSLYDVFISHDGGDKAVALIDKLEEKSSPKRNSVVYKFALDSYCAQRKLLKYR